jgi:hypothetical protein
LNPKRTLLAGLLAGLCLPSSAMAQSPPPPDNDHYLGPYLVNPGDFGNPGNFPEPPVVPGFTVDTSNATTQEDVFSPPGNGGGPEFLECRVGQASSGYGKTMWSVFRVHRYGRMRISTGGSFDSVIAVVPFQSPLDDPTPRWDLGFCTDRLNGFTEDFKGSLPVVIRGGWYAVQVGGYRDPATGAIGGGPVETKFEFERPARLRSNATLRGRPAPGGIFVTEVEVDRVPRGARVVLSCTRGGCGRESKNARLVSRTSFGRPVGKVSPADEVSGVRMAGARGDTPESDRAELAAVAAAGPVARAARSFRLLTGDRVDAGSTIEVRVTFPGRIGRYYGWKVRNGSPSKKIERCLEPFSNSPQKRCDG